VPDTPDEIIIDMSSISPIETRKFAARISALGAHYFDAPVSGGELGAKASLPSRCASHFPAKLGNCVQCKWRSRMGLLAMARALRSLKAAPHIGKLKR
jgi:hypothetical protein